MNAWQLDVRTKIKLTWQALRTIWNSDAALVRVPLDPSERRPMCATLADCCKTQHILEQTRALLADDAEPYTTDVPPYGTEADQ